MKDNIKVYVEMNPAAESFRDALVISTTSKKVKVFVKDIDDQAFIEATVKYPERKRAIAKAYEAFDKDLAEGGSEDVQTTGEGSRDTEDRGC